MKEFKREKDRIGGVRHTSDVLAVSPPGTRKGYAVTDRRRWRHGASWLEGHHFDDTTATIPLDTLRSAPFRGASLRVRARIAVYYYTTSRIGGSELLVLLPSYEAYYPSVTTAGAVVTVPAG